MLSEAGIHYKTDSIGRIATTPEDVHSEGGTLLRVWWYGDKATMPAIILSFFGKDLALTKYKGVL